MPRKKKATRSATLAVAIAPPPFALLATCFFASGAASLVFEVVWTRHLRLVLGSTTLAVSTILVAYMLGLGLGGLLGARWARRLRDGVRAYGWIEIGIGLYALLVPIALGALPAINVALTGALSFWPAALCRFVLALAVLLAPTMAMGATLPILVEAVSGPGGVAPGRVGLLYGLNTAGAVAGTLGATFVLFPWLGVGATNLAAALVDFTVGATALWILAPRFATGRVSATTGAPAAAAAWSPPLFAYAAVGFTSLTYEVCWTRALAMVLGSSIQAFATMLGAFLSGIALGSLLARRRVDRAGDPERLYAFGIGLLGVLALVTIVLFRWLPSLFLQVVFTFGISARGVTATNVVIAALTMIGPTLVLGALFPLLVRTLTERGAAPSAAVGSAYFANTLGSASGAFAAGFVFIPALGLQRTMALSVAINFACAGVLVLLTRATRTGVRLVGAGVAVAAAALVIARPPAWSPEELARGVFRDPEVEARKVESEPLPGAPVDGLLFYREGINSTVSVHRRAGAVFLRVNGKTDASTGTDMNTQVLLGQVPFLFGRGRDVLVIGFASGVTVGSAALHPHEIIDVVELEPAMVDASRFFEAHNNRPLENPGVRLTIDDGRNLVATSEGKYDVIISEPSNPWVTGASNLFTREFFAATRRALRPGGQLLQWVQFYTMPPESLRAIVASLAAEFPFVYGLARSEISGDLLFLARDRPIAAADLPHWDELSAPVRQDLERVGLFSTADLWTMIRLGPADVRALVGTTPVLNSDDNMRVELDAPWALHRDDHIDNNIAVLDSVERGVVPVLEEAGYPLTAEEAGALALSYLDSQVDPELTQKTLDAARKLGPSADAVLAEVALATRESDPATLVTPLSRLVQTHPKALALRLRLASALYAQGDAAGSLREAEAAVAIRPDDPRARLARLRALNELERGGEVHADAAVLAQSGYAQREPAVLFEAAQSAASAGDLPGAVALLRRYLDVYQRDPAAWYALAAYLRLSGREPEANEAEENHRRTQS